MMTPENKAQLAALIEKAESEGKWLHCRYQDLWFSPSQLRAENKEGHFVWGVVNWTLRDPMQHLEELLKEGRDAAIAVENFRKRIA